MTDWSQVGKKSRRKGKRFECQIAILMREITGHDWQTVRNSGRTDIKGDVYCPESNIQAVHIECKHNSYFSISHLIKPVAGTRQQLEKIQNEAIDSKSELSMIFVKNLTGIWLMLTSERWDWFIEKLILICPTYIKINDKFWFPVEHDFDKNYEDSDFMTSIISLLSKIREDDGEKN